MPKNSLNLFLMLCPASLAASRTDPKPSFKPLPMPANISLPSCSQSMLVTASQRLFRISPKLFKSSGACFTRPAISLPMRVMPMRKMSGSLPLIDVRSLLITFPALSAILGRAEIIPSVNFKTRSIPFSRMTSRLSKMKFIKPSSRSPATDMISGKPDRIPSAISMTNEIPASSHSGKLFVISVLRSLNIVFSDSIRPGPSEIRPSLTDLNRSAPAFTNAGIAVISPFIRAVMTDGRADIRGWIISLIWPARLTIRLVAVWMSWGKSSLILENMPGRAAISALNTPSRMTGNCEPRLPSIGNRLPLMNALTEAPIC